jgi:hypothetical protein
VREAKHPNFRPDCVDFDNHVYSRVESLRVARLVICAIFVWRSFFTQAFVSMSRQEVFFPASGPHTINYSLEATINIVFSRCAQLRSSAMCSSLAVFFFVSFMRNTTYGPLDAAHFPHVIFFLAYDVPFLACRLAREGRRGHLYFSQNEHAC